jgi:hypothetical protein
MGGRTVSQTAVSCDVSREYQPLIQHPGKQHDRQESISVVAGHLVMILKAYA